MWNDRDRGELLFLLKAGYAWLISAGLLLLLLSLLIGRTSMDSSCIGYLSSLVSFLSAAAAGFAAARSRMGSGLSTAGFCSVALIIVLLTTGFLIEGESMTSSSMISVCSMSAAGVMLGCCVLAVLLPGKKSRNRRYKKAGHGC